MNASQWSEMREKCCNKGFKRGDLHVVVGIYVRVVVSIKQKFITRNYSFDCLFP